MPMLKRKTLKTLTRLFTNSLKPLLPPAAAPRKRKPAKPAAKPVARAKTARPPARSAARRPLTSTAQGGRWVTGMAISPAGTRRYRLFTPADRSVGQRMPLVVMLHGCDQNADGFAASTRMHQIAAREGFVVLYPEQDRLANPNRCWNWFDTRNGRAYAEVGLIMQMVDQACTLYGADRGRVAIAGLSAGASMAALVVTRHPERFKAVAMHSGVPPGTARSGMGALSAMFGQAQTRPLAADAETMAARWPPLLVVHGDADHVVQPSNGQAAVRAWSEAAGAAATAPRSVQRGQRHAMRITDYRLRRRTVATLVEVARLGHAWSGGAAAQAYGDAQGPDASRLLWAFAKRAFQAPG